MDSTKLTVGVIAVSVLTGLIAATASTGDFETSSFTGLESADNEPVQNSTQNNNTGDKSSGLVYGSAHDHALFHVVINGSEKEFLGKKFQLNSKYVHLEGNRSDIVHKHAENVTWKYFLDTLNTTVKQEENGSRICISIIGKTSCGQGKIVLNGKNITGLEKEIEQGDNFLIIIGENLEGKIQEYMKERLPEAYRPEERGYSI